MIKRLKLPLPFKKKVRDWDDETDPDLPDFQATRMIVLPPRRRRRRLLGWSIGAATAVGLFVLIHVLLNQSPFTTGLEVAARRAISERFEGAQLTGHIHVGWLGTLALDGFRMPGPTASDPPTLVAERITVHPAFGAMLTGHLRPSAIELRWVRLQTGPEGAWLRALAKRLAPKRSTPNAASSGHRQAPPPVVIRDLFVDLPSRDLSEAPQSLGPLNITVKLSQEETGLSFDVRGSLLDGKGGRFSITGTRAEGEVEFQGVLASLSLAELPPGLFARKSLEINEGAFSGDVSGTYKHKQLAVRGDLTLAQAYLSWPRLANDPVGPFDFGVRGEATADLDNKAFSVRQATISANRGQLLLDASLAKDKSFQVEVRAADLDMQAAIDSLPAQLRPPPQAPRVQGPLSADFDIRGVVGNWDKLEIRRADLDLSGLKEVAGRDEVSNFLKQPFEFTPGGQEPPARSFEVGPGNPHFTPIASLPNYVVRAIVLSEDAGFYGHHGFDFDEIKESISRDLAKGQAVRGGSTLTQQLVKNLFLSREKKLSRKIQEALITLEIESALPKWRILEIYLNTIEWGPRLYGIGEAADRYFGERPGQLTPKQAAFLATIIPNPKKYYWYYARGALTSGWEEKVDHLLNKMAEVSAIDMTQRVAATSPLIFHRSGAVAVSGAEPSGDEP